MQEILFSIVPLHRIQVRLVFNIASLLHSGQIIHFLYRWNKNAGSFRPGILPSLHQMFVHLVLDFDFLPFFVEDLDPLELDFVFFAILSPPFYYVMETVYSTISLSIYHDIAIFDTRNLLPIIYFQERIPILMPFITVQ